MSYHFWLIYSFNFANIRGKTSRLMPLLSCYNYSLFSSCNEFCPLYSGRNCKVFFYSISVFATHDHSANICLTNKLTKCIVLWMYTMIFRAHSQKRLNTSKLIVAYGENSCYCCCFYDVLRKWKAKSVTVKSIFS